MEIHYVCILLVFYQNNVSKLSVNFQYISSTYLESYYKKASLK